MGDAILETVWISIPKDSTRRARKLRNRTRAPHRIDPAGCEVHRFCMSEMFLRRENTLGMSVHTPSDVWRLTMLSIIGLLGPLGSQGHLHPIGRSLEFAILERAFGILHEKPFRRGYQRASLFLESVGYGFGSVSKQPHHYV